MLSPVEFEPRKKMTHEGVQETRGYSGMSPIGSSKRRLLNQSTLSSLTDVTSESPGNFNKPRAI